MTEIEIAFDKAIAIIDSCETNDHFDNAQAYIDLFNEKFNDNERLNTLIDLLNDKKIKFNK